MSDTNIRAAKALGWKFDGILYYLPDGLDRHCHIASPEKMSFHDSYDWAMLLVKECGNRDLLHEYNDALGLIMGKTTSVVIPAPEQITLACLEVLEK